MIMRTLILIALFFTVLCAFAQRPLESNDISKEGEVYPLGKNQFARITISVDMNIYPHFKSMDMQLTPVEVDTLANKVYYHLHLDAKNYSKTNLEIFANGFLPFNLSWNSLQPNQWLRYYIYDPDPTIVGCYHQLMREGMKLFTDGKYEEARKKYESIKQTCTKIDDPKEVDAKIALMDSILLWRIQADSYFARADYVNAIKECHKILEKNPTDQYNLDRFFESKTRQESDCEAMFGMAEYYFEEKEYDKAQPLYGKIIDRSCDKLSSATARLLEIEAKRQLSHALTYEYAKNVPVGLSTGSYKNRRTSGYFTLRLNSDLFELIRKDGDEKLKPELNLSFGWTTRIVKPAPIWLFFGPGYTGMGQFVPKEQDPEKLGLKLYHAISPEAGLLGKIILSKNIGIALRYTFQYRFTLDKDMIDYVGKTRHVFGAGLCF